MTITTNADSGSPETYTFMSPAPPSLKYGIEVILNQHINRLKARLLNIAETVAPETRQCNAVKGLIKDAVNQAYFESVRDIHAELNCRDIERGMEYSHISPLRANSLADILVD